MNITQEKMEEQMTDEDHREFLIELRGGMEILTTDKTAIDRIMLDVANYLRHCRSSDWVRVEESPPYNKPVMVCIENKTTKAKVVARAWLEVDGSGWHCLGEGNGNVVVTHWQPLPPPPEEGE